MNEDFPPAEEPAPQKVLNQKRRGARGILTDEVQERFTQARRGGAYIRDAALFAGITEGRYYEWHRRGIEYDAHLEAGGEIIPGEDAYRKFALACDNAWAEARISAVAELRRAWQQGDWRAAAWYLERSDPEHWGRVQRVTLAGDAEAPVQVEVTAIEKRLAATITPRPLVEDAEVIDTVARALPEAAKYAYDDEPEEYFVMPSTEPYDIPE